MASVLQLAEMSPCTSKSGGFNFISEHIPGSGFDPCGCMGETIDLCFSFSPFFLKSTNKIKIKKTQGVLCAIELMMLMALPVLKVIASSLHRTECHT